MDAKGPKATLLYKSLDENEYTVFLYFDEPVIIPAKLEDSLKISISNDVEPSDWSMTDTNKIQYNAYSISITIEDDVLEGTIFTLDI